MSLNEGNTLKETIQALISSCGDKDDTVSSEVVKSLVKLAAVYPNEVIAHFCEFYQNSNKVHPTQLGNVIKVLDQTCLNHMKAVKAELASSLVDAMLRAMTENAAYDPAIQLGASSVLVAIGHVQLDIVLQSLIREINPTSVPHYTIPHSLGTLAAVNTRDIVPFIKDILSKMLPLLTIIKADATKQAFAYAFGHFAVAVSEQIGDNVKNDAITAIKENFVVEFTIIFDVLYNQWLFSNHSNVSESVLEALGPLTRLISDGKFNEVVNKLVLTLLNLYRKHAINPFYISQCISYILTPSSLNPNLTLNDNVINNINHTLFSMIVLEPDYDQPHTVKNHFEVLRCFDHMAGQFPEQTIEVLLHQCKNNQEKSRMKAVVVLTHLTTSSQVFIDKFAAKFIAILNIMTTMEQAVKMKKLIIKAIVGLVYRNCILNTEDFGMVEFIVKHCASEFPNVSKEELKDFHDTCKSSLILMCNSAMHVRCQLRDLLLHALTVEELSPSMTTVSHCLLTLLQNNSETTEEKPEIKDLKISPDLIFVRCITHLAEREQTERNKNLLQFLNEYSGDVHKNLNTAWTIEVERLLKYVVKDESNDQWHDMLLDLLVAAIEQVNSDKWVETIAVIISQQIVNHKQAPPVRGISLQYLAMLTCHMSNAAVIEKMLSVILQSIPQPSSSPMKNVEYISKAVGIASRQHGDYVINELDALLKLNEGRKGMRIMNILRSSKSDSEFDMVKYAIIVCYGKVASESLDAHVLARLADNVTSLLYDILKSNPHIDMCRASVTTLYEISVALLPAAHHNVLLRNRWQLLNAVLEQIYNPNLDKRNVELYPVIVKASKGLTKLQKGILPEERNTILRVFLNSIFGELSSFKSKYEKEGNVEKNDLLAKTLNDSLTLLHDLIKELIIQSTCLSTIDDLIGLLSDWLRNDNEEIRTASTLIMQVIFDTYIKNVKINFEAPSKFGQMGYLLGLIIPGIADTNFSVRLTSIDCIKLIIQIQYIYEGHTVDGQDECLDRLTLLQNNVLTNDLYMISEYSSSLCEIIHDNIPDNHTMQFIESLLEGYDNQDNRSAAISGILDRFFSKKGQELFQNVERIVEVILITMSAVEGESRKRLLGPITSLTKHHLNAVIAVLLSQRIPLKQCVIGCWRHLAKHKELASAIVENFLRLMSSIELFEDPYSISDLHIAALQPLTLISALGEMLQEPSMQDICESKFPDLFAVLYTTLACYVDAEPPAYTLTNNKQQQRFGYIPNKDAIKLSPLKITTDTLNAFLEQAEYHKMREACSLCLSVEHGSPSSVIWSLAPVLAGPLCGTGRHLARVVPALATYARSPLPPHRTAAIVLLAELLTYRCNNNAVLVEIVVGVVRGGWGDRERSVRGAALRAVAQLARLPAQYRTPALPPALTAANRALDEAPHKSPNENVPLASIQGLSRLLTELDSWDGEFDRDLLSMCQKIRPFMNTDCAVLRDNSIRLFGIISSKVKPELIVEQAVSSLPCFLLHLCDSNSAVVRASKFTLKQIFKTFNTPRSNDLVQTHLLDEGRLYIEDFMSALVRNLAQEMPDSVAKCIQAAVNYLNNSREDLRPYPVLLIGLLYMELYRLRSSQAELAVVDAEVSQCARARLLQLLNTGDARVRRHASHALTNLCLATSPHT